VAVTLGTVVMLHFICGPSLRTMAALGSQMIVATGVCVLLPEILLFNSQSIPFTEARIPLNTDLAFVVLRYVAMFPVVVTLAANCEQWIESRSARMFAATLAIVFGHEVLRFMRRRLMTERMTRPEVYDPGAVIQALGLRE